MTSIVDAVPDPSPDYPITDLATLDPPTGIDDSPLHDIAVEAADDLSPSRIRRWSTP